MRPVGLRTESTDSPLGLEEPRPRLSWRLQADPGQRDQLQSAYRVVVNHSEGVVWDSDTVQSSEQSVEYAGAPLLSRARYTWRVQVWERAGQTSEWSDAAWFETGLLEPGDWQAEWIGLAGCVDREPKLEGAWRIWTPAPSQHAQFRHTFHLPHGARVLGTSVLGGGTPEFSIALNDHQVAPTGDVSVHLRFGPNELRVEAADPVRSGGIVVRLHIALADQPSIVVETDDTWLASTDGETWRRAARVGRYGDPPWGRDPLPERACPLLRRAFSVDKPLRRARLYSSALGVYEAWLNGQRISDDVLAPGWTDYPTRVAYQVYDITPLVRSANNVIGAMLGDGWYAGYLGWFGPRRYGPQPLFICQLELEYGDDSRDVIVTDSAWLASTGEIVYSDPQMGESIDARLRQDGWTTPEFDASAWQAVAVFEPATHLEAEIAPRMAAQIDVRPVALAEPKPGVFVFDLGQNIVGWVRLVVSGERGQKVVLRFAEVLNPDGTLYTDNLRSAQATDEFILRGDAQPEVFEPRFTHHGFRYAEVTGLPSPPTRDSLTGRVVYARMPISGAFECSNPDLNQLQQNIQWGQRGNFLSVPTDCPQRDERLGWTGDAQVFCSTAIYNMDVQRFLTKWMTDVMDAQLESGAITHYAPNPPDTPRRFGGGAPGWADVVVIMPWTLYQWYGDTRILERSYAACARWIDFMQRETTDLIRPAEGFGDWLSVSAETPKDLIGTAYFAYSARLMCEIAETLGRVADADRYRHLFTLVRDAFQRRFVKGGGRLEGDTQTAYVLALFVGLLDDRDRPMAAERLVCDIRNRNTHLSTGFLGTPWLLPVLSQTEHLDVAYELLLQESMPSWLYPIKQGATTMWERWDSWTESQGPARLYVVPNRPASNMNSFNHYAYGSVGDWLYRVVAGIECAAPGYGRVRIRPRPGGGLTWARAHYDSVRGRVGCAWRIDNGDLLVQVEIPPNTTAEVHLPDRAMFEIGSGAYEFEAGLSAG